ncbi:hypothetical protein BSKO_03687 [Bryopsis sp. KO-2023]|nr:hypothetical protein BSKO_03687 [Bryopsis sp. KO-2023]
MTRAPSEKHALDSIANGTPTMYPWKFCVGAAMLLLIAPGSESRSHALRHYRDIASSETELEIKQSGLCVCIFDFDETLRVWKGENGDSPAPDGGAIVNKCRELGYEIAIASANCNTEKLQRVLPVVNDGVFRPSFFETVAFQNCDSWKTHQLNKILNYFGTKPECAMFFDDQGHNLDKHAKNVGVNGRHVRRDTGVTWKDFWHTKSEMEKRCNCGY